jgi:membrane-associated PAP2 superfamily phosphatase
LNSYKKIEVTVTDARWFHHPSTHVTAWVIAMVAMTLLWDLLAWDVRISHAFGTSQGFALTQHPIWGTGLYRIERLLVWANLLLVIGLCFRPVGVFTDMPQSERFFMLATLLIAMWVIQILKRQSLTSCPWSLQEFGGSAHYASHWMRGVPDGGSGHCFPAGHPSGVLSFLAVPVYMLWYHRRWAYSLLAVVLLAGGLWGATQLIRGAHYVSHTLWTASICLAVVVAMRALWFGLQRFHFQEAH